MSTMEPDEGTRPDDQPSDAPRWDKTEAANPADAPRWDEVQEPGREEAPRWHEVDTSAEDPDASTDS